MSTPPRFPIRGFLLGMLLICGCALNKEGETGSGAAPVSYYKGVSQEIKYPDVSVPDASAIDTLPPRTISTAHTRPLEERKDDILDLSLQNAVQIAVANNRIVRSASTFLSPQNSLYSDAEATPSVFDAAIQETGVLFGRRGVEAALSDFDAQLQSSLLWGKSRTIPNNVFAAGGLPAGSTLSEDFGLFRSALSKQFADGGSFTVGQDWNFDQSNSPANIFSSAFAGNLNAEYRRPLWAGAGTEFTRIAGPYNPLLSPITGVSQGVVIARINNDVTLAEFEASVRDLVKDVEDLYWELYLKYRLYHTAVVARQATLSTWNRAREIDRVGGVEGSRKQDEPQAREQYFAAKAAAEQALGELYTTETKLRRLLGLPVNSTHPPPVPTARSGYPNGYVLRPKDEPAVAELVPDWDVCLTSALSERLELRKQKWMIKSLELQCRAAKSLTNPQLDLVAAGQLNGFGDRLFSSSNDPSAPPGLGGSASRNLTQGDHFGYTVGVEFSMPLGFRNARAQMRNIELRLLKAQKVLGVQELEISHELAVAFQNIALFYANVKSNAERVKAAETRTELIRRQYQEGLQGVTVDVVVRAVADRADAESAFYRSVAGYNRAIADLEFRKGTLLEYNNIFLAEGEWKSRAYEQALQRAQARTDALPADRMLHDEPEPFARDPFASPVSSRPRGELPMLAPPGVDGVAPPAPSPTPHPGADSAPSSIPGGVPLPDAFDAPFDGPEILPPEPLQLGPVAPLVPLDVSRPRQPVDSFEPFRRTGDSLPPRSPF